LSALLVQSKTKFELEASGNRLTVLKCRIAPPSFRGRDSRVSFKPPGSMKDKIEGEKRKPSLLMFKLAQRQGKVTNVLYFPMERESKPREGFVERRDFERLRRAMPAHLHPC
jgi:hypothetical protein